MVINRYDGVIRRKRNGGPITRNSECRCCGSEPPACTDFADPGCAFCNTGQTPSYLTVTLITEPTFCCAQYENSFGTTESVRGVSLTLNAACISFDGTGCCNYTATSVGTFTYDSYTTTDCSGTPTRDTANVNVFVEPYSSTEWRWQIEANNVSIAGDAVTVILGRGSASMASGDCVSDWTSTSDSMTCGDESLTGYACTATDFALVVSSGGMQISTDMCAEGCP